MSLQVKCPAGTERHPVLSPNPLDVECRITGHMRPAAKDEPGGGKRLAPCCARYAECPIWKQHVEIARFGPSTKRQRDGLLAPRALDTLR